MSGSSFSRETVIDPDMDSTSADDDRNGWVEFQPYYLLLPTERQAAGGFFIVSNEDAPSLRHYWERAGLAKPVVAVLADGSPAAKQPARPLRRVWAKWW